MKKILTLSLLLFSVWVHPVAAESVLDNKELSLLVAKPFVGADFEKSRKLKILSRPFITSGRVLFAENKGLVWYTRKPIVDILLINEQGVSQMKTAESEPVHINNPIMQSVSHVFMTLFSLDPEKIQRVFTIEKTTAGKGELAYRLVPKDSNLQKVIAEIIIRGKTRIERIDINEVGGDSTVVTFAHEVYSNDALVATETGLLGRL